MLSLRRFSRLAIGLGLALTLLLSLVRIPAASAAPLPDSTFIPAAVGSYADRECFPQTGQCVENAFLDFWRTNGALEILGYPIDSPRRFNDGLIRQFFERAILEWHPENAPQYQVLLSRLGAILIDGNPETNRPPLQCGDNCVYFPETRHTLRTIFRNFWSTYGGLPVFGYPLTEVFTETNPTNGKPYLVQYFERNRFEYHPENQGRYVVLLGLLGRETFIGIGPEVVRSLPAVGVPNYGYGTTSPAIAVLPKAAPIGSTFAFIIAGLRPNTNYTVFINTDSVRPQLIEQQVFRTDANGVIAVTYDSSTAPGPGFYGVGAVDSSGNTYIREIFEILFRAGSY